MIEILSLMQDDRFQEAAQLIQQELLKSHDSDLIYALAVCKMKMGLKDEAGNLINSELFKNPDHEKLKSLKLSLNDTSNFEFFQSTNINANCLVSAIVSVYKSERFIKQCIENLLNQSLYKKGLLEIVLVNSGSPENEHSIILEFLNRYENIKYIYCPTRETLYKAWNRAIKISAGKYITNANTDDRPKEDGIEFLASVLESNPEYSLAYGDSVVTNEPNKNFNEANIIGYFNWPEFNRKRLFEVCYVGPHPMWKKSLHDKYGFFDENFKSAGDYEFWLRISKSEKFYHTEEVVGLYLYDDKSLEHQNEDLTVDEAEQARIKNWNPEWGSRPKANGSYLTAGKHKKYTTKPIGMMVEPLVSIIIPTCNRPTMVRKAVASVLSQSYKNIEVILINDGGKAIESLFNTEELSKIVYVNTGKNLERSKARNLGLKIARGSYIGYLDDDDWFYPHHVESLLNFMLAGNYDVAFSHAERIHQKLSNNEYIEIAKDIPYTRDFSKVQILANNLIPILCVLHKKECIERAGNFDETLVTHEDWDLWIRFSFYYDFYHLREVTCAFTWRDDGSSTTSTKKEDFLTTRSYLYSKYRTQSEQYPGLLALQENLSHIHKSEFTANSTKQKALEMINQGDLDAALKYFQNWLASNPTDNEALLASTKILMTKGRNSEAERYLKKFMDLNQNNPEILKFAEGLLGQSVSSGTVSPIQGKSPSKIWAQPDNFNQFKNLEKIRYIKMLEENYSQFKSYLASAESKNNWREWYIVAQEAFELGRTLICNTIVEQILIWEPEFWFARELPRYREKYYSQLGQDKLVEKYFLKKGSNHKRFIEVGAFDGIHYSNVRRLFEKYGWSGYSLEPVRKNFQALLDSYAGSEIKCIRAAASNSNGKTKINVSTYPHLPEWGTDVASIDPKETNRWDKYNAIWSEEEIEVKTINRLLEEENIIGFDFISIDAEGHDLAVLQGIDFKKHSPSLVMVEYGDYRTTIMEYMNKEGYILLSDNGQDCFFEKAPKPTTVNPALEPELFHPFLLESGFLKSGKAEVVEMGAFELLSKSRFDIMAKIIYGKFLRDSVDSQFGEEIYKQHLSHFNNFKEEEKNHFSDFKNEFKRLLGEIKNSGFNSKNSVIPVGHKNIIIDGAHRVAASFIYDKKLTIAKFDKAVPEYNFSWFQEKNMEPVYLDAMAKEFANLNPFSLTVSLFPKSLNFQSDILKILSVAGDIVYQKNLQLEKNGSILLMAQMYDQEPWVGGPHNNWQGAFGKARECFPEGKGSMVSILWVPFEATDTRQVKEKIRSLVGAGNHSVHINDTHYETKLLSSIYFNENSIHFLNNAGVSNFSRFWNLFYNYRSLLNKQGLNPENFCIDGSATLSLYGLRDCNDIDYLHTGIDAFDFGNAQLIGSHNYCMADHCTTRDDIIFNPQNHFYFMGIKFVSLGILHQMKEKRNEGKDRADINLINQLQPYPAPHTQYNSITRPFSFKDRPSKIVGLITVRNESALIEECIKNLSPIVDSIVVLDDASTDNTVQILKNLKNRYPLEHVIIKNKWYRDEPGDRNRLFNAGRALGGTHFIVIDADEWFTSNLIQNNLLRNQILQLNFGDVIELQWLQLWKDVNKFRNDDSVWTNNYKPFIFKDNWSCHYESDFIHTSRIPTGLNGKVYRLNGPQFGLLHFQFVNWGNLLLKQAWYRCLELIRDLKKSSREINEKYAPSKNETNMQLAESPKEWFQYFDNPDFNIFKLPDNWRKEQVRAWFSKYGKEKFKDLDIWDINWEETSDSQALQPTIQNSGPNLKKVLSPPSPDEIGRMFPLKSHPEAPGLISYNGVKGFLSPGDIVTLYLEAFHLPEKSIVVEIGSFFGLSSIVMAKALEDANNLTSKIYCIDLWEEYYGASRQAFLNNIARESVSMFINDIQENSNVAYEKFSHQSVDLLFIDGNHSYEAVKKDLSNYWKLVKPEGVLLGHDYADYSPGVVKAVSEFISSQSQLKFEKPKYNSAVFKINIPARSSGETVSQELNFNEIINSSISLLEKKKIKDALNCVYPLVAQEFGLHGKYGYDDMAQKFNNSERLQLAWEILISCHRFLNYPTNKPFKDLSKARTGLGNIYPILFEKSASIAFLGASVTAQSNSYADLLHREICNFTGKEHKIVKAAKGATGSIYSLETLENEVIRHRPTICFIEYLTGDLNKGLTPINEMGASIQTIVKKLYQNNIQPVFLYMYRGDFLINKETEEYSIYENVAEYYQVPSINVGHFFHYEILTSRQPYFSLMRDCVHTTSQGSQYAANFILDKLQAYFKIQEIKRELTDKDLYSNHLDSAYHLGFDNFKGPFEIGAWKDYSFAKISGDNQYLDISIEGYLVGIMAMVHPDSGILNVRSKNYSHDETLWDHWCHHGPRIKFIPLGRYFAIRENIKISLRRPSEFSCGHCFSADQIPKPKILKPKIQSFLEYECPCQLKNIPLRQNNSIEIIGLLMSKREPEETGINTLELATLHR